MSQMSTLAALRYLSAYTQSFSPPVRTAFDELSRAIGVFFVALRAECPDCFDDEGQLRVDWIIVYRDSRER